MLEPRTWVAAVAMNGEMLLLHSALQLTDANNRIPALLSMTTEGTWGTYTHICEKVEGGAI